MKLLHKIPGSVDRGQHESEYKISFDALTEECTDTKHNVIHVLKMAHLLCTSYDENTD